MNKVILIGRLTRDPEVRYNQGADGEKAIARFALAVDRGRKDADGNSTADFINCVAFGKNGEFAEKYLKKGTKILVEGRMQTGYYEKDGSRVYTTDVIVDHYEFVESKGGNKERDAYYDNMAAGNSGGNIDIAPTAPTGADGFMPLPDVDMEELPFA